eukprot:superscaffoldBa00002601_g14767
MSAYQVCIPTQQHKPHYIPGIISEFGGWFFVWVRHCSAWHSCGPQIELHWAWLGVKPPAELSYEEALGECEDLSRILLAHEAGRVMLPSPDTVLQMVGRQLWRLSPMPSNSCR